MLHDSNSFIALVYFWCIKLFKFAIALHLFSVCITVKNFVFVCCFGQVQYK